MCFRFQGKETIASRYSEFPSESFLSEREKERETGRHGSRLSLEQLVCVHLTLSSIPSLVGMQMWAAKCTSLDGYSHIHRLTLLLAWRCPLISLLHASPVAEFVDTRFPSFCANLGSVRCSRCRKRCSGKHAWESITRS